MHRIVVLVFIFSQGILYSQTTDWVKSFGGDDSDKGISIGADSLGFIYVSGYFNNEATFGNITLTNSPLSTTGNNKENFVFKIDSFGNVLWAIAGGDLSGSCCDDRALGMHVTPGGDVFITGTFWSSYNLGPLSVPNNQLNAHDNSLLAKIDTDGNPVWVLGFGGDNTSGGCSWPIYDADDHSYDVKVDDDGFIYVTGFFSGYDADFDNFTITNPEWGNDCQPMGYVGKLDPNGNWLWVDKFDGIKDQRGSRDNRIAIDKFSNIYVVGGFQNRGQNQVGNFGPFSLVSNGEWDAFIFKMDKDGNWLWAEGFGSNKTDRANGIAIDVCDDIYITGEYRNPMVFFGGNASNGTDTLSHKQKRDIFVAKMNNQGDWKWAKRARSSGTDKPYQMSVDVNKQVFIGGTTKGDMTFNDDLVVSSQINGDTTMSAWVAQLDGSSNTGDWIWAKLAGTDTDDDDRTNDICPDGFGNVYAVGFFEDLANFDGTILDASGRRKDIFVWKISMTPGSFTYSNSNEVYYSDSMVFNPDDAGTITISDFIVDGCDTTFIDSVINFRLGVQIIFDINNVGSANLLMNGNNLTLPHTENFWYGDLITVEAQLQNDWLLDSWQSLNIFTPNNTSVIASFNAIYSDSVILKTYPKPELNAFIYGNDTICTNTGNKAEVNISVIGGNPPYNIIYSINGDPKDTIITYLNNNVIYSDIEGVYDLISISDPSDIGSISGSALVVDYDPPTASINVLTDTLSVINPTMNFSDNSVQGESTIVSWTWNFGDNSFEKYTQNPEHTFEAKKGVYQVSLLVNDQNGCSDTTLKNIYIIDEFWIYIPNSFTPDNDQINDLFCISFNGIRTETFNFVVYNRYSEVVFSTDNMSQLECFLDNGWDGIDYNTGRMLPMGVYVYHVKFQDFEGWKHQDYGFIHLIK